MQSFAAALQVQAAKRLFSASEQPDSVMLADGLPGVTHAVLHRSRASSWLDIDKQTYTLPGYLRVESYEAQYHRRLTMARTLCGPLTVPQIGRLMPAFQASTCNMQCIGTALHLAGANGLAGCIDACGCQQVAFQAHYGCGLSLR